MLGVVGAVGAEFTLGLLCGLGLLFGLGPLEPLEPEPAWATLRVVSAGAA